MSVVICGGGINLSFNNITMTGFVRGALIALGGLIPAGVTFLLLEAGSTNAHDVGMSVETVVYQEDQPDIAEIPEATPEEIATAVGMAVAFFVDEFSPVQAIRQRDTLASVSIQEAMERTGLTRDQITLSIVTKEAVEGYLFEFDHDNAGIRVLMPPDTSVYPNITEAETLTGLPRELIILSMQEQKTVEGTKFEYEKK